MQSANDLFGSHTGSDLYYRHGQSGIIYTEGVFELVNTCQAFWLIEVIASHQTNRYVNLEEFQVWELERIKDDVFRILATDGNNIQIASQNIPFSDFGYDLATLWLVKNTLMLPSEY